MLYHCVDGLQSIPVPCPRSPNVRSDTTGFDHRNRPLNFCTVAFDMTHNKKKFACKPFFLAASVGVIGVVGVVGAVGAVVGAAVLLPIVSFSWASLNSSPLLLLSSSIGWRHWFRTSGRKSLLEPSQLLVESSTLQPAVDAIIIGHR
jgi:hypothetical protein